MLYSTRSAPTPEYFILDIIFSEPLFIFLVLLIPAGFYLIRKDIFHAKIIGGISLITGCLYTFSRMLYYFR